MAVLSSVEKQGGVGEANTCEYVCCSLSFLSLLTCLVSVRFAPPLVIKEEDLAKAVTIIGECLADLDEVRLTVSCSGLCDLRMCFFPRRLMSSLEMTRRRKGTLIH